MEWWGPPNRIEYIEENGNLLIRVTSLTRLVDLVFPVGFAIGASLSALYGRSWPLTAFLAAGCFVALYEWTSASVTELHVSHTSLSARTKTMLRPRHSWVNDAKSVQVHWKEIDVLEFSHGPDENDPSGLYANPGTILISQVNREEAESIIDTIYRRFPYVEMKPRRTSSRRAELVDSVKTIFGRLK